MVKEAVDIHEHETRIAKNSVKVGELESNLSKCGVKWEFQITELYDRMNVLKEELRKLLKVKKGWLVFYTKDVYDEETLVMVKGWCESAAKSGWFTVPSEFMDRIVFIGEDQSQYKMWLLMEKAKKNVIFIPVGNV